MNARANPISLAITTAGYDQWTPFGKVYTQ
jgi:hypothetical protein